MRERDVARRRTIKPSAETLLPVPSHTSLGAVSTPSMSDTGVTEEDRGPQSVPTGHDFAKLRLLDSVRSATAPHFGLRDESQLSEEQVADEKALLQDRKAEVAALRQAEEPVSSIKPGLQTGQMETGARAPSAIMTMGQGIPGGIQVETVSCSSGDVMALLRRLAIEAAGSSGSNADFASRVGPIVDGNIASNLAQRTLSGSFQETKGLNMNWNWRVSFKILEPVLIPGGGTGTVERGTGGSATSSTQTATSTTDSASGTAGGQSGPENSRASGSVTAGTSSTRGDTTGTSVTPTTAGKGTTTNQLQRYLAPIVVEAMVDPEADFSGSDYVNPFKWGFAATTDIIVSRQTGEIISGALTYYQSAGIAPTASPAPPVQPLSWIEHDLGITDAAKSSFAKSAAATQLDSANLSRTGSKRLPSELAESVERQRGLQLGNVNVVRGGPANDYCDTLNAAAFTTPGPEGGSDIFLHSRVALESPAGQRTLYHELAHAAQSAKGETAGLSGIGGDSARRQELERAADEHAMAMLDESHGEGSTESASGRKS